MDATTHALVSKVGHAIPDVRARAVSSLLSKIGSGVVATETLASETNICAELVDVCAKPELLNDAMLDLIEEVLGSEGSRTVMYVLSAEEAIHNAMNFFADKSAMKERLALILGKLLSTIPSEAKAAVAGCAEDLVADVPFVHRVPDFGLEEGLAAGLESEIFRNCSKLQCAEIHPDGMQGLFELGFRLKNCDDEATLLAHIDGLSSSLIMDYPVEAVLQQRDLFRNLLRFMHWNADGTLLDSALAALASVFKALHRAIDLAEDGQILANGGSGDRHDRGSAFHHVDASYPKALLAGSSASAMAKAPIDVCSHVHAALLQVIELMADHTRHAHLSGIIGDGLCIIHRLCGGHAYVRGRSAAIYLRALDDVLTKYVLASKAGVGLEGQPTDFVLTLAELGILGVATTVLAFQGTTKMDAVPAGVQRLIADAYNSESVAVSLPHVRDDLTPLVAQIDPEARAKGRQARELLQKFASVPKLLEGLKASATDERVDAAEIARIVMDVLPTIVDMKNAVFTKHITNIYFHLLVRSRWAFVDASQGEGDKSKRNREEEEERVHAILRTLLTCVHSEICALVYDRWIEILVESDESAHPGILSPLVRDDILGIVIVSGLEERTTAANAAKLVLFASKEASMWPKVDEWRLWLQCYFLDSVVGPAVSTTLLLLDSHDDLVGWAWLRSVVFRTFAREGELRKAALKDLYDLVSSSGYGRVAHQYSYLMASQHNLAAHRSSLTASLPRKFQIDFEGIHTVLSIFTSETVDLDIRKASALQLLLTFQEGPPSSADQVITDGALDTCLDVVRRCILLEGVKYDDEFLVTALTLMGVAGKRLMAWLPAQPLDTLVTLTAALFHSSIEVQHAAASLFFIQVANEETLRVARSGLSASNHPDAEARSDLCIPKAFEAFVLPPVHCVFPDVLRTGREAGKDAEAVGVKVRDKMDAELQLRRILQGKENAEHGAAATTQTIHNLHPRIFLPRALGKIKRAGDHQTCLQWIDELVNYCDGSDQAAHELSTLDWLETVRPFFKAAPISTNDWTIWCRLFAFITLLLEKGKPMPGMLMNVCLMLADVVMPSVLESNNLNMLNGATTGVKQHLGATTYKKTKKQAVTLCAVRSALRLAHTLVEVARARQNADVQKYVLTLFAKEHIGVLQDLVQGADKDYASRVAGMQLLTQLLGLYQDMLVLSGESRLDFCPSGTFTAAIAPFIRNICITEDPAMDDSCTGNAIRKHALAYLSLAVRLDKEEWASQWAQTNCTFWISRLSRNKDAEFRMAALEILRALSSPDNGTTLAMVAQCWPERLYYVFQIAFEEGECDLVRASAFRVIACAIQADREKVLPGGGATISESYPYTDDSVKKSILQTLDQHQFWKLLKSKMTWARPQLMGGMLAVLVEVMASDSEGVTRVCPIDTLCEMLSQLFSACGGKGGLAHGSSTSKRLEINTTEAVMPVMMAADLLQAMLATGNFVPEVVEGLSTKEICNMFMLLCGSIRSRLHHEQPSLVQYCSACMPLLKEFTLILCSVMSRTLKHNLISENELIECVAMTLRGICHVFDCRFVSKALKGLLLKLVEIVTQKEATSRQAMKAAYLGEREERAETIGAVLCKHLVTLLLAIYAVDDVTRVWKTDVDEGFLVAVTVALKHVIGACHYAKMTVLQMNLHSFLYAQVKSHLNYIVVTYIRRRRKQTRSMAVNERMVMHALVLLKHLAYKSAICSDALADLGVVAMVRQQLSVSEGNPQLQNECLGLLVNTASNSSTASIEIGTSKSTGPHTFFEQLFGMWNDKKCLRPLARLSGNVVQAVIQLHEARTVILKSGFTHNLIATFSRRVRAKDTKGLQRTLKFLSDLAAYHDSRVYILQHPEVDDLIEQIVDFDAIDHNDGYIEEALLFFRNMSFSLEMKTLITTKYSLVLLLLNCTYNAKEHPKRAWYASSALWTLLYNCQKVKAYLKHATDSPDKLLEMEGTLSAHMSGKGAQFSKDERYYLDNTLHFLHQINSILFSDGAETLTWPMPGPLSG